MADAKITWIHRLKEGYKIAKRPIAYIIMFIAVLLESPIVEFLKDEDKRAVQVVMLIFLSLILMQMMFEMYEKIIKEDKGLNLMASGELHKKIESIIQKEKSVNIKYIGVAGRNGWNNVLSKLIDENNPNSLVSNRTKFTIDVGLLNPEVQKDNSGIYERFGEVENISNSIKNASGYISDVSISGSEIRLHHYSHMPNMLGFLVNDNYLFVTYAFWENYHGKMTIRGGGTEYFEYDKNDEFGGQEVIRRFNGWFSYISKSTNGLATNNDYKSAQIQDD
ncbi:hypothetical protein [uncultured Algibacter sp.]|uniref:hypothetical protein n=1 Tax=uncultured Algibacter sp. TaxID=298659 RepID=UPI00261E4EA2|nr:hypothetical protein [uncultured Algibacter sp.]